MGTPFCQWQVASIGRHFPKRMLELPDVPTLQELGIEGFEAQAYWGLLGPTGIPPNIVNRMNAEVAKALKFQLCKNV